MNVFMNPWHNARLLNAIASWLMLLALFVCVAATCLWVTQRSMFAITVVEVSSTDGSRTQQFDTALLKTIRLPRLEGGFFRIKLDQVKKPFEAAPWVRNVQVRRVWPNRLQVEIEEHQALAQWDDGRMVNTFGEVFAANSAALDNEKSLPLFEGPEGSEQEITRRYRDLLKWLAPLKMKPTEIELSDRHAWKVLLSNGMVLLMGRDSNQQAAERVQRMVQALPEAVTKLGFTPQQIDLRHPNGFAIKATPLQAEATATAIPKNG